MKNSLKIHLLTLIFTLLYIDAFSQANKIINQDTIYYHLYNWNTKINTQLIPFDTTSLIVKFDKTVNKLQIINYLNSKNIKLVDSIYDYYLCELDTNWTISRSLDTLTSNNYFESVELNSSGILDFEPNDPLYPQQNHINNLNLFSLFLENDWEITKGDSTIIVAVIDAYIDWEHPDLGYDNISERENIWKNPRETPWANRETPSNDTIDANGNGYRGDWKGWDFYNNTNDTRPITQYDNHGTNVAGIIAGKTNNGYGISGIAGGDFNISNGVTGGVQIMPLNVCKSKNSTTGFDDLKVWNIAKAIEYAMKNDANIISFSLSLGDKKFKSNLLDKLFEDAFFNYNCLIYCSAGNHHIFVDGDDKTLEYPATNPHVYSVGAIRKSLVDSTKAESIHRIGDYENGYVLDFVAFIGYGLTTTNTNNGYSYNFDGTSAASPQLSGISALILSYLPCISNKLVYEAIKNTATNHYYDVGLVSEYIYDNNTNSNKFGYGLPNVTLAFELLAELEINAYIIAFSDTVSEIKYAKNDIFIQNGATLTITGELQMSEDKKIVVEPGGKLIIDGGKITSGCGWKGVEVMGLPTNIQNTSTFGLVELKNNAVLEHAMCGIKSIDGGIVKTSSESIFRNNYQSIVFEKYKENHQHTVIENTKFLCDGPVLKLLKGATGRVQASKEFIRIAESSKITIENCEFINEFKGKGIYSKVIGVNMYNAKAITIQDGCDFSGLSIGINAASLNGLLNFYNIKDNTFTNVDESIKIYNSRANIHNNEFVLASNAEISGNSFLPSVGVYTLGSVLKITDNNFSTEFNDDGYGLVIRNTKTLFESKIEGNTFSNLRFGTQLEQANKRLRLYCNSYSNISQNDWSVNPIYVGGNLLPMQGTSLQTLEPGLRRAGNLFYDRGLEELTTKHIRSSIEFVYNSADEPIEAIPEQISSIIQVNPFDESNDLSCTNEELPCVLAPCNPAEWTELLVNAGNEDSIIFYKQELLYSIALQDDISESIDILTEHTDSVDYLELLIGLYVNQNDYESASFVLQSHPQSLERDIDYYNFYTSLFDRHFNEIPSDSIPNSDSTLYADIMNHNNDVSDLVKAYLNFNFDSTFVITPEIWEEESSRPVFNLENKIKDRRHNQKLKLNTTIYPNPSNSNIFISYNSNEYDKLNINIVNILGKMIVDNMLINNNTQAKLNIESIPAGVYYINFLLGEDRISTKKIIIIH